MSFMELVKEIDTLEKKIRKKYPKQKGRVLIANAKEITNYAVDRNEDEFRWYVQYRKELDSRL